MLQSRGYLDRQLHRLQHVLLIGRGSFRPEYTAQSKVIRKLGLSRSEWEVSVSGQNPPWRIDVVVHEATVIEVRSWSFAS